MSQNSSKYGIYNIPSTVPFSQALVSGILSGKILQFQEQNPLALNDTIILLPTRRACQTISREFVKLNEQKGLILPRIFPIGDIDDEYQGLTDLILRGIGNFPQPVSEIKRQLLLTRLVTSWKISYEKSISSNREWSMEYSSRLATELSKLLDAIQLEGLDFSKLKELAPENFAGHWQNILEFLEILTKSWPEILSEQGLIDPAYRLNLALVTLSKYWKKNPTSNPVIIAGSTGTMPAVTKLMQTILSLDQGIVIIPGLDKDMDKELWDSIKPSHPQFALRTLLENLHTNRSIVKAWPHHFKSKENKERIRILNTSLSYNLESGKSLETFDQLKLGVNNLSIAECQSQQEEAGVIALKIRSDIDLAKINSTNKNDRNLLPKVALVTSDRRLAHRVTTELLQWNLSVDDSAGMPLGWTNTGALFRLTAQVCKIHTTPVDLLAILKHSLSSGNLRTDIFKETVKKIESIFFRGPEKYLYFSHLDRVSNNSDINSETRKWIECFSNHINHLKKISASRSSFLDNLRCHIELTEWLASTDEKSGESILYSNDGGKEMYAFLEELLQNANIIGKMAPHNYFGLFETLMSKHNIRKKDVSPEPFIFIWGPLEARLQSADITILGGLNEGSWPSNSNDDPWMSGAMREAFGLPSFEKMMGLSAHDFIQAASSENVMLTRSINTNEGPATASRWLTQLKTNLKRLGLDSEPIRRGKKIIEKYNTTRSQYGERILIDPPAPCPPIHSRPRKLSVTQIEKLMGDPYSIYARHILNLRPIDAVDALPGPSEKGTIIHEILDLFVKNVDKTNPDLAFNSLIEISNEIFVSREPRQGFFAFWWPRFERIAKWIVEQEGYRQLKLEDIGSEIYGQLLLKRPGGNFILTAKADRIGRHFDGSLSILDYKTSKAPSRNDIRMGKSPQLPLEAAIAEGGGFQDVSAAQVKELAYWHLSGGQPPGEIRKIEDNLREIVKESIIGLESLIDIFDQPNTPYLSVPRPEWEPSWNDYGHLARIKEWGVTENFEDESGE
tara:strand:- start:13624 stop:16674 length:3051 start_codon:yes stop_codon:yes gene_type:complete